MLVIILEYYTDRLEDMSVISNLVRVKRLDGGQFVTALYRGTYDKIGKAYKAVLDYCKLHGLKTLLPIREVYHKGPGSIFNLIFNRSPENYITEIQIRAG